MRCGDLNRSSTRHMEDRDVSLQSRDERNTIMNGNKRFFQPTALRAMVAVVGIALASHALAWSSGPLAGKEGRVTTTFNVYGAMSFHDRHDLRPFPSYIFKNVESMTVEVEANAEGGTPEIRSITMLIRNARTDDLGHWPTATPEQVNLVVAGRQASFVLDPVRLVADLGAFVEYGMTKVYVRIEYDLPPYEGGDWVEMAFVMVPPYRASLSSLSEILSVQMGRVVDLKPSSNHYYGVELEEVPATGYMVEPMSSEFFFDPPALSSDTGVVTLPYAAPAGTFSPDEARKTGEVTIGVPGTSRPIQQVRLLKAYATIQYLAGDVRIKRGLSPDYIPATQDMLVQPHDYIRMTVRPQQFGGLSRPSLGLQFYDGMRANIDVFASFDLLNKDVVISFDEQGVISQRHRNFITDLSDFAYTVGENPREYMRIGIKKTLGFLAGQVTGGFGWLASQAAEKTMEYGIDKISDYSQPSPPPSTVRIRPRLRGSFGHGTRDGIGVGLAG